MIEFVEFPKMPRLKRECIITEKIDGTNSSILILPVADNPEPDQFYIRVCTPVDLYLIPGSRTRWISPNAGDDNYGFAGWVSAYAKQLSSLGPGHHFGEWWGSGIQRGYGLTKGDKRWSLFNVARWCLRGQEPQRIPTGDPRIEKWQQVLPECCSLVPVLYRGIFDTVRVDECLADLGMNGSKASHGFKKPEGVVCFHVAGNFGFKTTLEKDHEHKGKLTSAMRTDTSKGGE